MMDKFNLCWKLKKKTLGKGCEKKCANQFLMYVTSIFMPTHEIFMFFIVKISSMTFLKNFRKLSNFAFFFIYLCIIQRTSNGIMITAKVTKVVNLLDIKICWTKIGNASLKSQGDHNLCAVMSFKETCRARKVFTIDTFEPSQINSLEK